MVMADVKQMNKIINFKPKKDTLKKIISSSVDWELKN